MLRKVDIHTHILPEMIPNLKERFGYGGFIRLEHLPSCGADLRRAKMLRDDGKVFREITQNCWDPAVRLRECDRSGVDLQVISTVPVLFSYWAKPQDGLELAKILNDHIASLLVQYPRRFAGLATLPLQSPELAVRELERCMKELKFSGIQIGSHVNDWNLNDPSLFPVFEAAQNLGASVFIHPWDMMGENRMQKYWLPWLVGMPAEVSLAICSLIFGGVLERLPNLRIAFAHGGGSFSGTLGRIAHGFHARPDLCAQDNSVPPKEYLGQFWVDSLVHDSRTLQFVLDTFGENKVALGSDYPFPLGEELPGSLIESMTSLSEKTKVQLLKGAALDWLGKTEKELGY